MTEALTALRANGHRRVALLGDLATLRPGRERVNTVMTAAIALGMECTHFRATPITEKRQLITMVLGVLPPPSGPRYPLYIIAIETCCGTR
jgi:hypothetical protein